MRRACRKIWRVVPCTSRKSLRTESREDIEEILKAKLATIKEEPEYEESITPPRQRRLAMRKQAKIIQSKDQRRGGFSVPLRQTYVLFIVGFASKAAFGGLLQY